MNWFKTTVSIYFDFYSQFTQFILSFQWNNFSLKEGVKSEVSFIIVPKNHFMNTFNLG